MHGHRSGYLRGCDECRADGRRQYRRRADGAAGQYKPPERTPKEAAQAARLADVGRRLRTEQGIDELTRRCELVLRARMSYGTEIEVRDPVT